VNVSSAKERVKWLVAIAVLTFSGSVLADPSIDAANRAANVNQEQCANVHTLKQRTSAEGVQKVAEVWNEVGRVYEEEGKAPYLLFWRGVLAQCLGRNELAVLDLESFVASQKEQTMFVDLVRQSKTRLRRLAQISSGARRSGTGASALWLRKGDVVEFDLSYGLATGLRGLGCTDTGGEPAEERDPNNNRVQNSTCVGGDGNRLSTGDAVLAPVEDSPPPVWPLGLRFGVTGFPLKALGFGAVLQLDAALQNDSLELHTPGLLTQLFLGPQLRILSGVSSGGRAADLRIAPRFAVAWGNISPWAGQKSPSDHGFLDAGNLSIRNVGIQLEVSGRFEMSPKAVLKLSGQFVYYFDGSPESVTQLAPGETTSSIWELGSPHSPDTEVLEVEERLEKLPELLSTSRLHASFRASVLVPHKVHNLAVGPFFELGFHRAHIRYPDLISDQWDAGVAVTHRVGPEKPPSALIAWLKEGARTDFERKVYSTRRQDLLFRIGVEVQFGLGLHTPKK
jgi:hypothetical protein